MSFLVLTVATVAAVLTYIVGFQAFKTFTALRSPRLIAVIVAVLTGLSLFSLGGIVVALILVPYAALGLSLLLLPLVRGLNLSAPWRRFQEFLQDRTAKRIRRQPGVTTRPVAKKHRTPVHLRETPPTEE